MSTSRNAGETGERGRPRAVVVRGDADGFSQQIRTGPHRLTADEPEAVGGTDSGPSPYDLLLASLGACTSITVAMYARRKQWPLERVEVTLRHEKIHAADCESCEASKGTVGRIDRIEREIELVGLLSDEQRDRLMEIADKCPVHKTLNSEVDIRTRAV